METPRDNNFVPAKMGVLFSDGITLIPIAVNPVTGGVKTNSADTIGFTPGTIALRDENHVSVMMAENSVDGTLIPVYVDADGAILVDV